MLKYRATKLIRHGFIGMVLMVLVIAVGLQPDRISQWVSTVRHQALFKEAGGLSIGDEVWMSGIKVGSVTDIALQKDLALVTFTVQSRQPLGSLTSAHIRTQTLLGRRMVTLRSDGSGSLRVGEVIPVARTSSPYSLTEALSELTVNTAGTDTQNLNQALDTLSQTIDQITPQLAPTFDGLTRVSKSLNNRDEALGRLLERAGDVTEILAQRSQQLNTLILDGNTLIGVLNERREAMVSLLASVSAVSRELSGLVADNEQELAPTLAKLNSVTAMLEKNSDNIAKLLPGLAKYEITAGETVSTGFYYNAFIPNLSPSQFLQPFLDYAFGFRRGTDAGQPPDNAGPRAELPLPYNGIPGGSR